MFQVTEPESERFAPLQAEHLRVRRRLRLHRRQLRAAQARRRALLHRGRGVRQRRARSKNRLARQNLERPKPSYISGGYSFLSLDGFNQHFQATVRFPPTSLVD